MEVENIPQKPPQNEEEINKKNKTRNKKPKKIADSQKSATTTTVTLIENSNNNTTTTKTSNNSTIGDDYSGIKVSMFDDCVDNHLKEMEMIHKLCEEDESSGLVDDEIERIASNITFLREWRYFNYSPRTIRFASEKGCPNGNVAVDEITLSQFSAAMVPNCDAEEEIGSGGVASSTNSRKDFALYVGGLVWSLDWCPRTDQETNTGAKCEFIAVAAHPPDSTYHKQGVPLSGRGMVQIWCLLNHMTEDITTPVGNVKRKYKVSKVAKTDENKPVRPRGRPRKNAVVKNSATVPEGQTTQALVVHLPENPSLAPADKAILSLHNDITPVSEEEKHQNYADNEKLHNIAEEEKHQMEEKKQKNPRGRIRKNIMDKTLIEDPEGQFIPALAVCLPEDTSIMPPLDKNLSIDTALKKGKGKKRKAVNDGTVLVEKTSGICSLEELPFQAVAIEVPESINNISPAGDCILDSPALHEEMGKKHNRKEVLATDLECTLAVLRRKSRNKKICNSLDSENNGLSNCDEGVLPSLANLEENYLRKDSKVSEGNDLGNSLSDPVSGGCQILKNDVLPKAVLCVGHDGKVAWDVKWRPLNADIAVNKHRMGYLAVVLGNGSLEVWEVPSVQVINRIYASRHAKGTDPRFAKLNPVFRCSILKYAGKHSMPLTVEWSTSPPHDLILAGCHDGVVALWKFSVDVPSEDVRPLLCFSAETGPIRSLSWAPFEGDPESSNIFVTAGHGGLKFWDLRDPFRPLWDANPSQRFLYGLDWVPDPRCVLVSYDDGTLRMLSLSRAAYDVPVTGQPFNGTQQQGLHSYSCSSFAVWSIHVSRRTGMVAYCCADGTVLYFQLTHKAVDRDPLRNRAPHFLCGSLANEESTVTMNTQLPGSPHRMKKSATEWANTPRPSRTVASGLSQSKRTRKGAEKSQKPDDQVLALDYGDDTESGVTNKTHNSVKGGKGKTSESSKAKDDQALISVVEDRENTKRKPELKEESIKAFEVFPPKIVSMYRVRWNLNKGSERWLSYGGAAGIVRCQEIFAPKFDKKCLK